MMVWCFNPCVGCFGRVSPKLSHLRITFRFTQMNDTTVVYPDDIFWAFEGVDGHWTCCLREYQQGHLCRLLSRWKKRRCWAFNGDPTRIGDRCVTVYHPKICLVCLKNGGYINEWIFPKKGTRGWCHFFFCFFLCLEPMSSQTRGSFGSIQNGVPYTGI